MLSLAAINPAFAFAFGLSVALIILLVLEIYNSRRISKVSEPVYEYAIKKAQVEAERIVNDAREQARKLIATAEEQSVALTGAHASEEEQAEKAYEGSLKALLERLEQTIASSTKMAEEMQQKLSAHSGEALEKTGSEARTRLEHATLELQNKYTQQLDQEMTALIADTKKQLAEYERARKEAIEREIMSLVGETVRIVLGKNLPPEMHAALVKSALEEAKATGVF